MSPQERDQAHRELLEEVLAEQQALKKTKPAKWPYLLIAGLLILLMVLWYVPSDIFPEHAKANKVPSIEDITTQFTLPTRSESNEPITAYVENDNPALKQLAATIVTTACSKPDKRCYAEALFYFVRDNINYVYDPVGEYYEYPEETLLARGADCDGHAILLASLLQTVGIQTKFNYDMPDHVAVEAWLLRGHLFDPDYVYAWTYFDPTCTTCAPGEKASP